MDKEWRKSLLARSRFSFVTNIYVNFIYDLSVIQIISDYIGAF